MRGQRQWVNRCLAPFGSFSSSLSVDPIPWSAVRVHCPIYTGRFPCPFSAPETAIGQSDDVFDDSHIARQNDWSRR